MVIGWPSTLIIPPNFYMLYIYFNDLQKSQMKQLFPESIQFDFIWFKMIPTGLSNLSMHHLNGSM